MTEFVHLHVHTEYSLLDGAARINELVCKAKELGQTAIAITDHGVMYGAIDFYKACKAEGIKPIIGCEVYVAPRSRFDKVREYDANYSHLVLLCKNETGYKNLIKLVSLGFTEGFYSKPRIDRELLEKYSEGLIALSACLAGEIPKALKNGDYNSAKQTALWYYNVFGRGNYYLEMQNHGIKEQEYVNPQLVRLSKETGIGLVATNDVHYVEKDDSEMQKILICIGTGHTVNDDDTLEFPTDEFYLKSGDEMASLFPKEAISNSVTIANMCNFDFEFGKIKLPYFDIGSKDHFEFFKEKCYEGLYKNYGENPSKEIVERLEYELGVINSMGYVDYYLIVWDFVSFAKSKNIPVGPGRGSGAGSIAAFCMGITGVDPIKYNLLFERFLNPERVSMPDFDIDFCYVRRQEVIDYVKAKYGETHVAQIVTFGTLAARAAVRDVGRAMALPYATCDKIAKMIPAGPKVTISSAFDSSKELKSLYNTDMTVKRLIDYVIKVEGMPRHASTHAAGVVITDKVVSEYVPLANKDDAVVTQYTMTALDELGLLKMDFLGLRNLTVIADAEKLIKRHTPSFLVENIPINDPETMKMMSMGKTEGVFQFESAGMKSVLVSLKPRTIEDLTAVISLYRPGPRQYIPTYIYNKNHPQAVKYDTPLLKPILDVTYGCIVYQEQVMQIFRSLAGYSLGRADIVRRAMSKKKHDVLAKEKNAFLYGDVNPDGTTSCEGCIKRGVDQKTAEKLFESITEFSSYAFNKSHACAYSFVAYRTAYLKCHYTKEYMAALMTSVLDSTDKIIGYVSECERLKISVLPPDVNDSYGEFTSTENGIRFGLLAVKNLGIVLINQLVNERKINGPYKSLFDLCNRLYSRDLNTRALEALAKCGAFDSLHPNRKMVINEIQNVLSRVEADKKYSSNGQMGLFDSVASPSHSEEYIMTECEDMPTAQRLAFEKETTGLYLSGHPLQEYGFAYKEKGLVKLEKFLDENYLSENDNKTVSFIAMVDSVKVRQTKSNNALANIKFEDMTGSVNAIAFASVYSPAASFLKTGAVVKVIGRLSVKEEEVDIICEKISPVSKHNEKKSSNPKNGLYLKIDSIKSPKYAEIKRAVELYKGSTPLYIYETSTQRKYLCNEAMWVECENSLLSRMKDLLGEENVVFVEK